MTRISKWEALVGEAPTDAREGACAPLRVLAASLPPDQTARTE